MLHTNTRIYSKALELLALSRDVQADFPRGFSFLSDQLLRAASSVVHNFSEGCGKNTPRDRRRYFAIAKGSACEVAGAIDVAHTLGLTNPAMRDRGHDLCDHIAAMLHLFR